ncbi:MAG: 2-dehydropantoate 2-reductase [Croceibacterium sp.]
MKPRIAIIGPGAVGGTVAAWLLHAGHDVTLCARTPFADLVVETPDVVLRAQPPIWTEPAAAAPVDWVFIATKTYAVAGTAAWLDPLMGADTRVAVLQNGVEHIARFAPFVPEGRILPVVVDVPAERDAPGRIRQRRAGTMLVPGSDAGRAFAALFAGTAIAVTETADLSAALWRKLAINVAGAVSALAEEGGGVAWREPAARLMRALVAECIAVGRAEGAMLDDDLTEAVVAHYRRGHRDAINSLHADRSAGRPMEWDARNGVVGRLGRRHAITTPVSDAVSDLLAAIDERASGAE